MFLRNDATFIPNVLADEHKKIFKSRDKATALGLSSLLLVPIRKQKTTGQEDIEAILAIYPADLSESPPAEDLSIISGELGAILTVAHAKRRAEMLDSLASHAQVSRDLNSYLHRAAIFLRDRLRVQAVSIFVWNGQRQQLLLGNTTGMATDLPKEEILYASGEGKTGQVFASGHYMILQGEDLEATEKEQPPKFVETTQADPYSYMAVPILGEAERRSEKGMEKAQRRVIGVVRCVNKRTYIGDLVDFFSPSDADVLEDASALLAPHFELFQAEQRRISLLARISHEILQPVTSIRGTADHMLSKGERLSNREALSLAADVLTHGRACVFSPRE